MILFLGAGASRAFGIPTMLEFVHLFTKEVGDSPLYKQITDILGLDRADMEGILTILSDLEREENDLWQSISPHTSQVVIKSISTPKPIKYGSPEIREEASRLLLALKGTIRLECNRAINERREDILNFYTDFIESARVTLGINPAHNGFPPKPFPPRLRVFTTNYDTTFETFANDRRIPFSDGFIRKFRYDELDTNQLLSSTTPDYLIVKLHGSVDVFRNGDRVFKLPIMAGTLDDLRTSTGESIEDEFLVYPVEASGVPLVTESPFRELYEAFRKNFTEGEPMVVIGFSFRDRTLTSMINSILFEREPQKRNRIWLVDPKASQIKDGLRSRYQTLAETIIPVDSSFGRPETLNLFQTKGLTS